MSNDSGFQVGSDAPQHYDVHTKVFMAPFVQALVAATVGVGQSVLDVACGTGHATRAAALAAGPGARIDGSDLNPAMLERARSIPDASGTVIAWCQASALDLPYDDASFDAVICQQGLQFFPDPAAGVREMARVGRASGRLGATVWSAAEDSPYLHRQIEMLVSHTGVVVPDWTATEQQLLTWFAGGAVHDVAIELVRVHVDLPDLSAYALEHLKALPWSAGFFRLSEQQQSDAVAELVAELADYRTEMGIRVPFSSYLVTATI